MMVKERESPDELPEGKIKERVEFQQMDTNFLAEKSPDKVIKIGGFDENSAVQPRRAGSSGFQELTLSYLCDNSKLGFHENDATGNNPPEKIGKYKGKEVVSEDQRQENNMCVVRDFLQLNESRGVVFKREADYMETDGNDKGKKPKVESLNLSLALPDVSLSLAGSNRVQDCDFPSMLRHSRSLQSFEPSFNNRTTTTYSNDFTAASLSYTHSQPHSHNPSCSLTDYSLGSHRLNCGEGTNGSVHSRFRPIGDGTVALANHFAMRNNHNNSIYKNGSSENYSFFPSELPARPVVDADSGDSRGRGLESFKDSEDLDIGKINRVSRSERIVREIVAESIPVMAQTILEITDEIVESAKEYLRTLINNPEKKDDLVGLQKRLERRSDLTRESLLKSQRTQLELFVAIKMGLASFLSSKARIPTEELIDIFLLERCRNVNCKRALPVEDCDCRICSTKKGFCSECMCPLCFNFDSANNTCSWVGCDVCSHWCHAACAIQKNLIKPGPSLKGISGVQYHCLGCGHASEMFGFVKDVFMACAKNWGLETLAKELDCVRKVFQGSEDQKGKELHMMASELLRKLEHKRIDAPEICNLMFKFFNYAEGLSGFGSSSMSFKDNQPSYGKDTSSAFPPFNSLTPKPFLYNMNSSSSKQKEIIPIDLHHNNTKIIADEWSVKPLKKDVKKLDGFDSLESMVRVKEAEARMFQNRADEARREVENYRRMVRMQLEKLDEEYGEKLTKLCLQETEERQRKKMEELKALENSHCDYYNMKIRMQSDISGLLKRMEATKQQIV